MRTIFILLAALVFPLWFVNADQQLPATGCASWYGETHRGRLMANGKKFDPEKLTAASWFYPLGTRVVVTLRSAHAGVGTDAPHSVIVTITDRGPAKRLVREGRIIDLAHAAFEMLAPDRLGLIPVQTSLVP